MNRFAMGSAIAAAVLLAAAPCAGAWRYDEDHSWSPTLGMVIFRLEGLLSGLEDRQEINRLLIEIADLYDAELYVAFHDRLQELEGAEREEALIGQVAWLVARQEAIDEVDAGSDMRSTGPAERALLSIGLTRARLEELEAPLRYVPSDSVPEAD